MERETVRRERKSKRLLEMRGKGDQTIQRETKKGKRPNDTNRWKEKPKDCGR